jgi:hypothetical protein
MVGADCWCRPGSPTTRCCGRPYTVDGVNVSPLPGDGWLVRASTQGELADALASVPRPPGRLRVEVDPTDV